MTRQLKPILIHLFPNFVHFSITKVITSQVCSWEDVEYIMYNTAGNVASDSEYGCDVNANELENVLLNTTSCEETIVREIGT